MDAQQLLRSLGITGNLKGFHYAAYMIERIAQDPTQATLVTKCLYPDTAKHFGTTAGSVERGLRTAVQIFWERGDRELLERLSGTKLQYRPSNSVFLDMAAACLRQQE